MNIRWKRRKKEEELNEEVRTHLEMAARERVERGEDAQNAQAAARREFGGVELVKETARDAWGWRWTDDLLADVRYALRTLHKNWGFTIVAVLTLMLGIGANTALFSIVNGVLLNPLPYPAPEQLVTLHESKPNFDSGSISYPNFRDWQKRNHSFTSIAISRRYGFNITGLGEPEQVRGDFVSSEYFSILGVKPKLGRFFLTGEDEIGAAPIAILSEGFWKRKMGASPDAVGKSIAIEGSDYTIVGIVPATFNLSMNSFRGGDVYLPIGQWGNPILNHREAGLGIHGIGRMKPGVTIQQARADMESVTRGLTAEYPDSDKGIGASLIPIKKDVAGDVEPVLLLLLAAVGFVLLIACVNVANLLLARHTGRMREFAVRTALGAGKGRLLRQLLTESVVLAIAGGSLGLLLAAWGTQAALKALPGTLPRVEEIGLDARVLLFTAGVTLLAGILFGLAPARKTLLHDVYETLKEGGRGASGMRHRAQSVFVVLEMAMALVLLVGAGLMIRSLAALWGADPGFRAENAMTLGVWVPSTTANMSADAVRAQIRELDRKFGAVPGVQAISQVWGAIPIISDDESLFWMDGQPKPSSEADMNMAIEYIVEPQYLKAMGTALRRGRFFTEQDNEHSPTVVAVDEVFARKFFGDVDPIGKRINLQATGSSAEIVGIVAHVNQWGLDSDDTNPLRAELYIPCMQMPDAFVSGGPGALNLVVRYDKNAPPVLDGIRRASREMNGKQVIFGAQTLEEIISDSLATQRFAMILLGSFAGIAVILASVGIYGVISYLVGQRTQEIGVRVALGAMRRDVLVLVLGEGLKLTLTGVGVGLLAALGLAQLMKSVLYGVSASDPLTFVGVGIVLTGVAVLACYMPARRAMKVDPLVALRYE